MGTHSSILAWRIPWTAEPGRLQSAGSQRVGHDWAKKEKESKVQGYKEQYWIGVWNARSLNRGKLDAVKHEMARVNIDILGISELKWTGMGEFNSDDHYIYYCGQESLRRNGVAFTFNKRKHWYNLYQRMFCLCPLLGVLCSHVLYLSL